MTSSSEPLGLLNTTGAVSSRLPSDESRLDWTRWCQNCFHICCCDSEATPHTWAAQFMDSRLPRSITNFPNLIAIEGVRCDFRIACPQRHETGTRADAAQIVTPTQGYWHIAFVSHISDEQVPSLKPQVACLSRATARSGSHTLHHSGACHGTQHHSDQVLKGVRPTE